MTPNYFQPQRRKWLMQAASLAAMFSLAAPASALAAQKAKHVRLASAWQLGNSYHVGVLSRRAAGLVVTAAVEVPTRAHGVWVEASGSLLAVARRPGDWLLRWQPDDSSHGGKAVAWGWIEPDRAFNGHVIASADGRLLYSTETHLETGAGLIGVRDAATLEKIGEWSTGGSDPHELLLDEDGFLLVANGGISALPETGRIKLHPDRMDASLVRLDARSGELLGQWRVADKRLSLRHIAWGPRLADSARGSRVLGIAMQAEHDDAADKAAAPVLAIFDGKTLKVQSGGIGQELRGYGGDIAFAAGRFSVSCPRAHGVAHWRADGSWAGFTPLKEACALASLPAECHASSADSVLWAAGNPTALAFDKFGDVLPQSLKAVRLDNHWSVLGQPLPESANRRAPTCAQPSNNNQLLACGG